MRQPTTLRFIAGLVAQLLAAADLPANDPRLALIAGRVDAARADRAAQRGPSKLARRLRRKHELGRSGAF